MCTAWPRGMLYSRIHSLYLASVTRTMFSSTTDRGGHSRWRLLGSVCLAAPPHGAASCEETGHRLVFSCLILLPGFLNLNASHVLVNQLLKTTVRLAYLRRLYWLVCTHWLYGVAYCGSTYTHAICYRDHPILWCVTDMGRGGKSTAVHTLNTPSHGRVLTSTGLNVNWTWATVQIPAGPCSNTLNP